MTRESLMEKRDNDSAADFFILIPHICFGCSRPSSQKYRKRHFLLSFHFYLVLHSEAVCWLVDLFCCVCLFLSAEGETRQAPAPPPPWNGTGRQRPLDKIKSRAFSVSIVFCSLCPRCLIVFYSHSISVFPLHCATELPAAKKKKKINKIWNPETKPKNQTNPQNASFGGFHPYSFPLVALKHVQPKTVTLRRDFASTSLSSFGQKSFKLTCI